MAPEPQLSSPARLFVARPLISLEVCSIEEACADVLGSPVWRKQTPATWHITALFLGDQPTDRIPEITEAVRTVAERWPPFILHNGALVTMPPAKPSMLWVRFQTSVELQALHVELAERTGTSPSPHVPFLPHITLARTSRSTPPIDGPLVLPSLRFDQLTLFRSDPSPIGRMHHPLATWEL